MKNKLTTAISSISALLLCACAGLKESGPEKVYNADIIVYGGTSAAVTAAIQASAIRRDDNFRAGLYRRGQSR